MIRVSISILVIIGLGSGFAKSQFFLDEFEDEIEVARALYNKGDFVESASKYEAALLLVDNKYPMPGYYYELIIEEML